MKSFLKILSNDNILYRKEQRVICAILLGFLLSGICLPTAKEQLLAQEASGGPTTGLVLAEKEKTKTNRNSALEGATFEAAETLKTVELAKSEEVVETPEDPEETEVTEESGEETDVREPSKDNSAASQKKPITNNSGSAPTQSPSIDSSASAGTSSTAPPASTQTPPEPPKVWVPPVYTTVHHDAVYETRRVVVCNYCGATFGSAGEFQVHKDANGG